MQSPRYLESLTASAVDETVARWRETFPAFSVLALLPEAEAAAVPLLQHACMQAGIGLAGAIFPALVLETGGVQNGAILLPLVGAPAPLLVEDVSRPEAVERLAERLAGFIDELLGESEQEATLFCIFDALIPNIATHLDAWYLALADRVHYAGVNAGSERFVPIDCLFDNTRCIAGGVLLQLLPGHTGAALAHGFDVPEQVTTATSATGNRVVQIDWRPALEMYRETMAAQYGVAIDRDNFYSYAVHFPFGILRADGTVLVRIPVALDDAGGIFCVGEIPPNSVLLLLDARSGAGRAPVLLAEDLAGTASRGAHNLLTFYCAGRRMHMGEQGMRQELADLARRTGQPHLYGALSLGEIGESGCGGYPLFHNATLVGIPWGGGG
ncbi:FIST signal transduction protein [Noviherbaspirillum sp. ST9]|uniref:FIST signal transduction protein n=1 Tax=Noviherbaspirillum sp. ST9 TaxID=3401606 RepID=UPI003B5891CF